MVFYLVYYMIVYFLKKQKDVFKALYSFGVKMMSRQGAVRKISLFTYIAFTLPTNGKCVCFI